MPGRDKAQPDYNVSFYSEDGLEDFKRRAGLEDSNAANTDAGEHRYHKSSAPSNATAFGSDFEHQRRINAAVLKRNRLPPSAAGGELEERKKFYYDPHLAPGAWQRYVVETVKTGVKAPPPPLPRPRPTTPEAKVVEKIVEVPVEVERIVYRDRIVHLPGPQEPEEEEEEVTVYDTRTVMVDKIIKESFTDVELRMVAIQVPVVKEV